MDFLDSKLINGLAASICFGLSTPAFKIGIETGDQRFTIGAFAVLSLGYVFFVQILASSMISAVVLTSMLSQAIAIAYGLVWLQEPLSVNRGIGMALALAATIAFSLPEGNA